MRESARIQNLINYFKKNISKGYTFESLKWALINQGYSKMIIEKAIEQTHKELAEKAPVLKEKPKIKYLLMDENDNPVPIKKSFFRKVTDFFK